MMITSGETALATTSDTAITLILNTDFQDKYNALTIINESAVAGFFSCDGGMTWARLEPSAATTLDRIYLNQSILVKRVAGGSNVTGLFGFMWRQH